MYSAFRDPDLSAAARAAARQSWIEAAALMKEVDERYLGSELLDYLLLQAHAMAATGASVTAEAKYRELLHRFPADCDEMASVWSGLGQCAHQTGDERRAIRLTLAAESVPFQSPQVAFDVYLRTGIALSHLTPRDALKRFRWIETHFPDVDIVRRAALRFEIADALLRVGQLDDALKQMEHARRLAARARATVTLAHCIRRTTLLRTVTGQQQHTIETISDLDAAAELYRATGDRGETHLSTEAGEVYRSLERPAEAAAAFRTGLRLTRQTGDRKRIAHNLLGLFELTRRASTPDWTLWEEALQLYHEVGSVWGVFHTLVARGLASPPHSQRWLGRADSVLSGTPSQDFTLERALLSRYAQFSSAQLSRELHLMTWP